MIENCPICKNKLKKTEQHIDYWMKPSKWTKCEKCGTEIEGPYNDVIELLSYLTDKLTDGVINETQFAKLTREILNEVRKQKVEG